MDAATTIRTPVAERTEMKKEGSGEFVNPTYFKSVVGSLRYLTSTRHDIVYGVGLITRYMEKPRQSHLQAAKRILRYVNSTRDHGILYTNSSTLKLVGYTDSDWAGDLDTRKSTSSYVFYLGDGVISWSSKKQ
ncbi:secreted RxLR effector protein 161-like [Silene latifolia]|uniref:secreted RxLR effector protein 161-like n=1 Tax=Silene latifolia TaxID=37657 RepID=UPI003D77B4C9